MKLVIGNKNYSSWSMRPWLLMTQLGIAFEEERLHFGDPTWKQRARRYAPTGLVPILVDGEMAVWDSLAIVEYLAEAYPSHGVWPAASAARAGAIGRRRDARGFLRPAQFDAHELRAARHHAAD